MLTVVLLTDDHRFDLVQLSLTTGVLAVALATAPGVLPLAAILVALAVHTVLSAFGAWLGLPKL